MSYRYSITGRYNENGDDRNILKNIVELRVFEKNVFFFKMNLLKRSWIITIFSWFLDVSMFWVGFFRRFDSNTGVIFKGGYVHGFRVLNITLLKMTPALASKCRKNQPKTWINLKNNEIMFLKNHNCFKFNESHCIHFVYRPLLSYAQYRRITMRL